MRIATLGLPIVLALAVACSPPEISDGGVDEEHDAGMTSCASEADCDDGLFCNGEERCEPGHPDARADGCVAGAPPCPAIVRLRRGPRRM